MSRPIGVSAITILVLISSAITLHGALSLPNIARRRGLLVAIIGLAILTLLATRALWTLRRHAFFTFMLWALCIMFTAVLQRMSTTSRVHAIQLFPPIIYLGLGCALAALYLRRLL